MLCQPVSIAEKREIKIKEAEICLSMGLLNEALNNYEWFLSGTPDQNVQTNQHFRGKIRYLKEEIDKLEQSDDSVLPTDIAEVFRVRVT
jgi:hypothetical protein